MSTAQPGKWIQERRKMALIVAIIMVSLVATGFIWGHHRVNIVVDGKNISVNTLRNEPENILSQAGIKLGPEDEYRLSTVKVTTDTTIEVFRAVPVTINYQGKSQSLITAKPTVNETVSALGIPKDNIKLVPDGNTRPLPNMLIKVITLSEEVAKEETLLPAPVLRQPDPTMEKGLEEVVEEGQDGTKLVTNKLHFEDGQQVSTEKMDEKITVQAKPQIIKVGTRDTVETSRGAVRFRRVEWMEATAYHPLDGSDDGITYTGMQAGHGIVAVDPKVIRLGTRVFVPGYGLALAADTGSDIIGQRIDLCMENRSDAWSFGRHMVKVYILAE